MDYTDTKSACIIGAGVAGLAAAKALRAVGVACTVFEKNERIGGVWTDGYLDFGVQVQKELYEFPEYPLPDDTPLFAPGPVIQTYLEDYAARFNILDCIRLQTPVESLSPTKNDDGWQVNFLNGDGKQSERFDLVVVCVGLFSNIPIMPDMPNKKVFNGKIHHVSQVKTPDVLAGKRVAVIGYGKSATDAALSAKEHARSASIVARSLHWPVPRKLAGILPFKWGLLNRLTTTLLPLYKSPSALELRVHKYGKPLAWSFWRAVELLLCVQYKLWSRFGTRQSLVPADPVEIGAFSEATMIPRPEFYTSVRDGSIDFHRSEIGHLVEDGLVLSNGTKLDVDAIICATGWKSDYSFLSEDVRKRLGFEEDGVYLYRQILHPDVPGMVFLGYASTVSNTLAYTVQAYWLAALVAGKHVLPDTEKQMTEIDKMKRWKRDLMPSGHARAARLIAHLQHYVDELLRDLGINHRRKTGLFAPLAEVFAPYEPKDYRGISSDDLADKC